MKIGVDARSLCGPRAGVARYLRGLLDSLAEDTSLHFFLYVPRPLQNVAYPAHWRVRVGPAYGRIRIPFWYQGIVPFLARRERIDVFWGVNTILPLALPSWIPSVVTVHDLVHRRFPETMETKNYLITRALFVPSLRRASCVVANSEATAAEVISTYGVSSDKVHVVPPGVSSDFHPRDPQQVRDRCASTWGVSPGYLLCVGTLEPRKNLRTVIQAVARLPAHVRRDHPLLVCGAPGWKMARLREVAAPLVREGSLRFLGYVRDEDLPWLYAGAAIFLFPSLYEGFGIPLVEAMRTGIPIVASDIPAVREVTSGAAVLVLPCLPEQWAETILTLLRDERWRADLSARGLSRASVYSWRTSARRLREILTIALSTTRRFPTATG